MSWGTWNSSRLLFLYFLKINALPILRRTLILKRSHIYYIYTRSLSCCLSSLYPQIELFMRNLNANKDTKPWGPLVLLYLTPSLFKYSCRIALSRNCRNFKMRYDKTFARAALQLTGVFSVWILNNSVFPKWGRGTSPTTSEWQYLSCFFSLLQSDHKPPHVSGIGDKVQIHVITCWLEKSQSHRRLEYLSQPIMHFPTASCSIYWKSICLPLSQL